MNESPKILFSVSQEYIPDSTPQPSVPYFVIFSPKGPVEEKLVDKAGFEAIFGKPDVLNYGTSALYSYLFLERTKGVAYVRRALHVEDVSEENIVKYSGVLARWIKDGAEDFALAPVTEGVKIGDIANYPFKTSTDDRQIFKVSEGSLFEPVTTSTTIKVRDIDNLLDDAGKITVMASNEVPDDDTELVDVLDNTSVIDIYDYVKFTTVIGSPATTGDLVREVAADYYDGYLIKDGAWIVPQTVSASKIEVNDGNKFEIGEHIFINSLGATVTYPLAEIIDITGNTLTIDIADYDSLEIVTNETVSYNGSATSAGAIKVSLTDGVTRAIPRVSVTNSTAFDIPDTLTVVATDLLYLTNADVLNDVTNEVVSVVASGTAGYNTVTVTSAVTLSGEDDEANAFDIVLDKEGFIGRILRELISPQSGLQITVREDALATTANLLVTDNDVIAEGMDILIDDGTAPNGAYSGSYISVSNKYNIDNSYNVLELSGAVTGTITSNIYVKVNASLKEKDAMLILALTPGKHGQTLTVDIQPNEVLGDDYFDMTVIENGKTIESARTCSRLRDAEDAFGNSLFVEDVFNGSSRYIWVIDNPDAVSPLDGLPYPPLYTDSMVLKPAPVPVYDDLGTSLAESVSSGDSVIRVKGETETDLIQWSVGDTLSILNEDETYSSYEVYSISIDPLNAFLADITVIGTVKENHASQSVVMKLAAFNQGPNITIQGNDVTVDIGDSFTYQSTQYTVVDSGSNYLKGGQDGLIGETADFLAGFDEITNTEKFPEELLISDSGFAKKDIYSSLSQLARTRERCMLYGSIPQAPLTALQVDYTNQAVAYADSTLTGDKYSSITVGYSQYLYGPRNYWLSDHLSSIINQYLNTIKGEGVLPAANNRGKITGINKKDIKLDTPYQDILERKHINYARAIGSEYTIISNTTRFGISSYFQLRHIIHYINAVHSIVGNVFTPYLQEVVTDDDVRSVDASIGNLLTRNLKKMTQSYETSSNFLSAGNGTTTWNYKLYVQPKDVTTKILFDMTVTNKTLEIKVEPA